MDICNLHQSRHDNGRKKGRAPSGIQHHRRERSATRYPLVRDSGGGRSSAESNAACCQNGKADHTSHPVGGPLKNSNGRNRSPHRRQHRQAVRAAEAGHAVATTAAAPFPAAVDRRRDRRLYSNWHSIFCPRDHNPNLFRYKNTKNRKTGPNRIDEEITHSGVPRR